MSLKYYLVNLFRITLLSAVIGTAVAFFLTALDAVTRYRWQHPWLLYLLPVSGIIIYLLYTYWGKNSDKGSNLLITEIQDPEDKVPRRMAPLVLLGTLLTHLTGGSAGREGTAVQMGGSITAAFFPLFTISKEEKSLLLSAGMSAGFGAVFGTPLTGAIFALEVISIGHIRYKPLLFCLLAGFVGHYTCETWGVRHTLYSIVPFSAKDPYFIDPLLLAKAAGAGILFGLVGRLFAWTVRTWSKNLHAILKPVWLVPVAGGIVLILLGSIPGAADYLGLGVTTPDGKGVSITSAFQAGGADTWSWVIKLAFTAITLGSGFKGGEVTPLFFIGATLGNILGTWLGAPIDLMAGLGFIAVFAGATNTPLACTLMGAELFGGQHIFFYATACICAYMVSGHKGIYGAQTVTTHKSLYNSNSFLPNKRLKGRSTLILQRFLSFIRRDKQKH